MTGKVAKLALDALTTDIPALRLHIESLTGQAGLQSDGEWPNLNPKLIAALQSDGIKQLYRHQDIAIRSALAGEPILVSTGTNSGKTICYTAPILSKLAEEPFARALFLYPTKALAQDQLQRVERLAKPLGLRVAVYDGDTPKSQRGSIRKSAHIILSNPDMVHAGMLPNHENWRDFYRDLRFVVLDEMHQYRGVFGAHVAFVLRRLNRIAKWYGSRHIYLAGSATVANGRELFKWLTESEPLVFSINDAAIPARTLIFALPDEETDELPDSPTSISATVTAGLSRRGLVTLTFCRSRAGMELVLRLARERLASVGVPPKSVDGYRGGYTVQERRQIEQALFKGELSGLVSTNALELGIDVGGLNAVVMNGFPTTISSFWQQAGRAGRRFDDAVVVVIPHNDPLESFYARDPKEWIGRPIEHVALSLNNENIVSRQLRCAAYERPLLLDELATWSPAAMKIAQDMIASGELTSSAGRLYYPSHEPPASSVSIRSTRDVQFRLYVHGQEIGAAEEWRAIQFLHEEAIYIHRGNSFQVKVLDLARREVHLIPFDGQHTTQPVIQTLIEPLQELHSRRLGAHRCNLSALKITQLVGGFTKRYPGESGSSQTFPLTLPPIVRNTVGIVFEWELDHLGEDDPVVVSQVHALEHALLTTAPMHAGCDRGDLGSTWSMVLPPWLCPVSAVFDLEEGGVGLSETLFDQIDPWVQSSHRLLTSCKCQTGCPRCLMIAGCESGNEYLDKQGAIKILSSVMPVSNSN